MVLIVYFLIGVLMNIIGPIAKIINKRSPILNQLFHNDIKKAKTSWNKILFELFFRIICIIFFPILLLGILIDFQKFKHTMKLFVLVFQDINLVFFSDLGGEGTLKCNSCNFNQEIVSFIHGFGTNEWSETGFQCQKCGKFHSIENDLENSKNKKCECGGLLDREEPLFCPKCKAHNVSFSMNYIT